MLVIKCTSSDLIGVSDSSTQQYAFQTPIISALSVTHGPCSAVSSITLTVSEIGLANVDVISVNFYDPISSSSKPCTSVNRISSSSVSCSVPTSASPGAKNVTIAVRSQISASMVYTYDNPVITSVSRKIRIEYNYYIASSVSPLGGATLVITGYNFVNDIYFK